MDTLKLIWAFDQISWYEPGEEPESAETGWPGNLTSPAAGEIRWARHRDWEGVIAGTRLWSIYQPELLMLNGAEDHPDEFELCTIVEAEVLFIQPPFMGNRIRWAQLRCLRSIRLQDIPRHFPIISPEALPTTFTFSLPQMDLFRGKSLLMLTRRGQEMDHESWICTNTRPRQVVLYERGWDWGRVQICNFPLQRKYLD